MPFFIFQPLKPSSADFYKKFNCTCAKIYSLADKKVSSDFSRFYLIMWKNFGNKKNATARQKNLTVTFSFKKK